MDVKKIIIIISRLKNSDDYAKLIKPKVTPKEIQLTYLERKINCDYISLDDEGKSIFYINGRLLHDYEKPSKNQNNNYRFWKTLMNSCEKLDTFEMTPCPLMELIHKLTGLKKNLLKSVEIDLFIHFGGEDLDSNRRKNKIINYISKKPYKINVKGFSSERNLSISRDSLSFRKKEESEIDFFDRIKELASN